MTSRAAFTAIQRGDDSPDSIRDLSTEPLGHFAMSVVITAHGPARTLADTLESLLAQTWKYWEAIVVDDGSIEETQAIAAQFAAQDERLRRAHSPGRGVSAARNVGMMQARLPWLLFLDASDTIAPDALERFADALARTPDADAAHCGRRSVAPDGRVIGQDQCTIPDTDLFGYFAASTVPVVLSCVVRRALAGSVGGWDESLGTSEHADFWQRVARAGARFVAIPETLVACRVRPGDGMRADRLLRDRLEVVRRAHAPDPRVQNPVPRYANGASALDLPDVEFAAAAWAGGIELAAAANPVELLALLGPTVAPGLRPACVADAIFRSVPGALYQPVQCWREAWPAHEQGIVTFLQAIEARARATGLARRAGLELERLIVGALSGTMPVRVGATSGLHLDVGGPLVDERVPCAERLVVRAAYDAQSLGELTLPVCDGVVPAAVLGDAIAAEFAWTILGHYFNRHLYSTLHVDAGAGGAVVVRGTTTLASPLPADGKSLHDAVGWELFLQEIFGAPTWTNARFYDAAAEPSIVPGASVVALVEGGAEPLAVELCAPLPEIATAVHADAVLVEALVGGASLGIVRVAVEGGRVMPGRLRVAVLLAGGLEICRVAVREALVGRPADDPTPLRERLLERAAEVRAQRSDVTVLGGTSDPERLRRWRHVVERDVAGKGPALALGRPAGSRIGGAASRYAALPSTLATLLHTADTARPRVVLGQPHAEPALLLAIPGIVACGCAAPAAVHSLVHGADHQDSAAGGMYDRHYFESLFASGVDPWRYTSPYEQRKYEHTLAILPSQKFERALELACAEGHFTQLLAPRVVSLVAADISDVAIGRAASRCASAPNIAFRRIDIAKDELPGGFDLIVCSEVLYYMGGRTGLATVASKMAAALAPDGWLVMTHVNVVADAPGETGFDWAVAYGAKTIGETFAAVPGLRFEREIRTPLYRVQLFHRERKSLVRAWFQRGTPSRPRRLEQEEYAELEPQAAVHVLWEGGSVEAQVAPPVTRRLPVLMYHSVAPAGPEALRRWRVTPTAFEEQLRYLRDAGFRSATLDEWREANERGEPLPGRRILITFDDGYLDFAEHAWPLLRRYGFHALVFVVTDRVGGTAVWDVKLGSGAQLLSWADIRALHDDGVAFGSHTATHPELTLLDPAALTRELAASRATLERELMTPVRVIAYPYGDQNSVVTHIAGACGYEYGLVSSGGATYPRERLLSLSRIEVSGDGSLENFVARFDD